MAKSIHIPTVGTARPVRRRADGKHYWRWDPSGRGSKSRVLGWLTEGEAAVRVAGLVLEHQTLVERDSTRVLTVADLLDVYLGDAEQDPLLQPQSVENMAYSARAWLRVIGDLRLDQVTDRRLSFAILEARAQRAATTVRNDWRVFRAAWNWGRRRGLVRGELGRQRIPGGRAREDRVPSADEVIQVVTWLRDHDYPWTYRAARLLWATGARRSEIDRLTWPDVTDEGLVLGIHDRARKSGRRVVSLEPGLLREIDAWKREAAGPYVIGLQPSASKALHRHFERACEALAIAYFPPKSIRNRCDLELIRLGAEDHVFKDRHGHTKKTVEEFYARSSPAEQLEIIKQTRMGQVGAQVVPFDRG